MRDSNNPFYAQLNFYIDIHPINEDGSLNPNKLTQTELTDLGVGSMCVFGIQGFNLEDCIKKLQEVLQKLKYEQN